MIRERTKINKNIVIRKKHPYPKVSLFEDVRTSFFFKATPCQNVLER
jgi:hypothetical protein